VRLAISYRGKSVFVDSFLLAPQNLLFCLEPVVELRARLVAALDVEFKGS